MKAPYSPDVVVHTLKLMFIRQLFIHSFSGHAYLHSGGSGLLEALPAGIVQLVPEKIPLANV